MSTWEYVPEESIRSQFGMPVNKNGYYISPKQPSDELVTKAKIVLTELFALLDRLDIDIAIDSEQGVSIVCLDDEHWTVSYMNRDRATIAYDGYTAGTLIV